jgi:mono/diheme cytochrome c family protein
MTNSRARRTSIAILCVLAWLLPVWQVRAEDVPPETQAAADAIWQSRCATCHGATGKGDGAAAAALTPKPRDFSSPSWQASVTDEHIEKIIAQGGQPLGLSMLMPANPDLVSKPDVIKALRAHVRGLAAH